jgi:gliding motility-associated-like protein
LGLLKTYHQTTKAGISNCLLLWFVVSIGLGANAQVNLVPNGGMEVNPNCNVYLPYYRTDQVNENILKAYKTNFSSWYCVTPNRYINSNQYCIATDKTFVPDGSGIPGRGSYVCYYGDYARSGLNSLQFGPVGYAINNFTNTEIYNYIGTGLFSKMEKDTVYRAEMWVSKYSIEGNSISGIGMYFAEDSCYQPLNFSPYYPSNTRHKYAPGKQALMNKPNNFIDAYPGLFNPNRKWHRIRFYYTAKGNEQFLILGDFTYDGPCHVLDAPAVFTHDYLGRPLQQPQVNIYTNYVSPLLLDDISVVKVPKSTKRSILVCKNTLASLAMRDDFDSCVWQDGSTLAQRSFSAPGIYWVKSYGWTEWVIDTLEIKVLEPGMFSKDTLLEFNTKLAAPSSKSYLWSTGDTSQTILVKDSGIYWVSTQVDLCSRIDTFRVSIKNERNSLTDTLLCYGRGIALGKRKEYKNAIWHDGDTAALRYFTNSGIYWVKSSYHASISVIDSLILNIQTENTTLDTGFCSGLSLILKSNQTFNNKWNTGDTNQQITVKKGGIYWVEKNNANCLAYDTFLVKELPALGYYVTDTSMCKGATLRLDGGVGIKYLWDNLDTTRYRMVSQNGAYWLQKQQYNCTILDTFKVNYFPDAIIPIPADTGVCFKDGLDLTLNAGNFKSYLWEPGGETTQSKRFTIPQTQKITVVDHRDCYSTKDINITDWCRDAFFLPNAFTPNKDGLNDYFLPVMNNALFYELRIYNQWGVLLFTSTQASEGWDGKFNGQESPAGVYVAWIKYKQKWDNKEKAESINFTLLR